MPLALRITFGAVVLILLATSCIFLYRRLLRDAVLPRHVRRIAIFAALGLTVFTVVALLWRVRDGSTQPWVLVPRLWLALIINLIVVLLPVEIGQALRRRVRKSAPDVSADRRIFLARSVAAGGAVLGAALTGFGAYRAYEPAGISEVPVRLPGLPRGLDGLVLAQLSDLHVGALLRERFLDDLIERTNALRPDLVAITGDLVDGTTARLGSIVARLANLRSRHGTFFVTGNHDYYSGASAWVTALRGLGITVLRNVHTRIGDAGASFDLIGVDDWGSDYDLDGALRGRDPARASVLLAHQPNGFDAAARHGLGLQLSGHTHGGQMFPATLIADLVWGERSAGLSRIGESHIYVSRGCGFVGPAQRAGSPSEIAKVVLLAG